ncbi:MAG: ABC transporter ATP-binding protein [Acidimicrobiia bacterium]
MTASEALLTVERLDKTFVRRGRGGTDELKVLDGIDVTAGRREFVTIIGPSGCGKSTLLNCIAGLTTFDAGSIVLDGRSISGPGDDRSVVFQHASLLPWYSVEKNVAYGLRLRRDVPRGEIRDRVAAAIHLVGLDGFEHHFPHEISGGMQQRVNLARALAVDAKLVLMDEPFGALDALTKEALQDELSGMIDRYDRATIFITHDIREAVFLGDKVIVMSARPGRIVKEIEVSFPRPRSRDLTLTPEFEGVVADLRQLLNAQVA